MLFNAHNVISAVLCYICYKNQIVGGECQFFRVMINKCVEIKIHSPPTCLFPDWHGLDYILTKTLFYTF
jgi:hypothetical protein